MDLAWGTIAALLLLLPGFFFSLGLLSSEQFSRDTRPRSVAAHLAAITFVSFLTHAGLLLLLWIVSLITGWAWCDVNLVTAAHVAAGPEDGGLTLAQISQHIYQHIPTLVGYVVVAALCGLGIGHATGRKLVHGRFRALLQHKWVYGLIPPYAKDVHSFTTAHVMTRVQADGRCLCYRGTLAHFALDSNGQFSYVVLRGPKRFYMVLDADTPRTSNAQAIGASLHPQQSHESDSLYIDGESIENVVFDRIPFRVAGDLRITLRSLHEMILQVNHALGPDGDPSLAEDASDQ